ncbi:putative glycosyltransferase [Mycobacterium talmoniae]|uniref:Putative glycosyltransferase n=1 Tax=Mycobacterium talmoniae TaxID=1858794 RepID=A0A2S8BNB9_9MYCO|nr:putative glycosyltransferase [Mycobacterium talmoniae]
MRIAVSPDVVGFAESAGLAAVAYGPDSQSVLEDDSLLNFWKDFPRNLGNLRELNRLRRETKELFTECWGEMSATLTSLADGADLLISGPVFEQQAANVGEYYDIPLATLHTWPTRVNGHLIPILPSPLMRSAMAGLEWLHWRETKRVEDAQRRELGLPETKAPSPRRMTRRGSLEIQAYDEVCFPGLAAEWAKWHDQRPFVGTLTLQLATDADDEVTSWIAAGTPPIYFGFGSIPVDSPADTLAMIGAACAQLGERALVCSGWSDFSGLPDFDHVKVVRTANHAAVFPACSAVVHHGGAGTTAAGLRAGVPTLILWTLPDHQIWGAQIKRLMVGTTRRFSGTTRESLVADLRTILSPQCVTRAREIATRMTEPATSVATTADLIEEKAGLRRVG